MTLANFGMTIQFYNSLSRSKEAFQPLDSKRVTAYVCGPTVYARAHIGNYRPVIVFDCLYRLLRKVYGESAVVFARNVTDVEDKIINACSEQNTSIKDLTSKFASLYGKDCEALGALPPTIEPWATDHIQDMIAMISVLLEKQNAYIGNSGVWFSVGSMANYGKLSRRDRDDNLDGARVDVDLDKRDPADFALWKFSKPEEPEDAKWDSPWGKGRPGWHIECSAMAAKHLGETIDIHGGGIDLQFPHHENEIAQSECSHGKTFARFWLHNGLIKFGDTKMAKSQGNIITLSEIAKDWPYETIRYALLTSHYRADLNWTSDILQQSNTTLDRIYSALRRVWNVNDTETIDCKVLSALSDDLNTPLALSHLSGLATNANVASDIKDQRAMETAKADLLAAGKLLGLLQQTPTEWEQGDNEVEKETIEKLIEERLQARLNKDYTRADEIRERLTAMKIEVMDNPNGSTWRRTH